MVGHLDIRVLKVVMDQVDLAIKEPSLDAVLAAAPVPVDHGQPVVLLVERPVGDGQLVVPLHHHLPAQTRVPHNSWLGADHCGRESSRTPGLRICCPDGGVVEGDGTQVGILLGSSQVDRGLHWLARVGALTNRPDDLLVVEADVRGEEALGGLLLSSGRHRGAVADLGSLPVHVDASDGQLEGAHLPHHLLHAKSHRQIAHHPSTHSLQRWRLAPNLESKCF